MEESIFEKVITGSASKREKAEFNKWIQESESNVVYFKQIKTLWEESKVIPETVYFDSEKAKTKIRSKIAQKNAKKLKLRKLRIGISVAATIIVLLGITSVISLQKSTFLHKTIEHIAQNGVNEVVLPDGSTVWINEHSTLIVPEEFKENQRNVKLLGEAYFEIARDESRPFKIRTGKTITKVLGTSFNIKMDSFNEDVSLVVNSGKVAFYRKNKEKHALILTAGNMAEFTAHSKNISKGTNDNLNYLAWKTGVFIFQDALLKDVCKDLSQYYKQNVSTALNDPNLVITGTFENDNLEDILSTIQLTLDVKIKHQNNQIVISK